MTTHFSLVGFQVDYVDASRNQVVLKMIPRIDYSRRRGVLRTSEETRKKAKRRPPAKLFDPDSVRYGGGGRERERERERERVCVCVRDLHVVTMEKGSGLVGWEERVKSEHALMWCHSPGGVFHFNLHTIHC